MPTWSRLPLFWRAQILGWGLFSILNALAHYVAFKDAGLALVRCSLVFLAALVLSSAIRAFYVTHDIASHLNLRSVAVALVLSLGSGVLIGGALYLSHTLTGWNMPERTTPEFLVLLGHYAIAFAGWNLCYFWVHAEMLEQAEHRRAQRAESEALRAELEELRLQLDPHFLFNALNGVAEEIPEHPKAALAMLRDLTAYLRHSLNGIHQTVVTVEAEVAGLSAYLRVQQARFGERLKVEMTVDPASNARRIASFLLQPLVENAVKHGNREEGLKLRIAVALHGDTLTVEIDNTGTLRAAPAPVPHRTLPVRAGGIGLANVRRRLELHYPGRHAFALDQASPGVVRAHLTLTGEPCSGS